MRSPGRSSQSGRRQEPTDEFRVQREVVLGFRQERLVLTTVLRDAAAQVLAVALGIGRVPGNGVELVVAHDRLRGTRVEHFPDDANRLELSRSAVDEVPDEDRAAFGVSPRSEVVPIAELLEQ